MFYATLITAPLAFALMSWGHGGEHPVWLAGAAVLLNVGTVVDAASHRGRIGTFQWHVGHRLVLGLFALGVIGLAWSANRFITLQGIFWAASLAGFFVVAASMQREAQWILLEVLCLVFCFLCLYGFGQWAGCFPLDFWHNAQFAARFVNSAHFASLAAAAFFVALGLVLAGHTRGSVMSGIATLLASVPALCAAQSRSVWLITAALVVAFFAILAFKRQGMPPRLARRMGWLGMIIGVLIAVSLPFFGRGLVSRFASLMTTQGQSLVQRGQVWRVAIEAMRHNPAGVGLGCFGETFLKYKSVPDRFVALRAHNELLQIPVELGWLSMPILAALLVCSARYLRKQLRHKTLADTSGLQLGLTMALLAYGLHSLVDFPLRLPSNTLFAAAVAAVLWPATVARDRDRAEHKPHGGRLFAVGLGGMAIACAIWWSSFAVAADFERQGRRAFDAVRWEAAETNLQRAAAWMPCNGDVFYLLGRMDHARSRFADHDQKHVLLHRAHERLGRAIRIADSRAMWHVRHAWVLRDLGRAQEAEEALVNAIASDPMLARYSAYYADFLLREDRFPEAAQMFRQALDKFHDNAQFGLRPFLKKFSLRCQDASLLARIAPEDENSQRILQQFLMQHASHADD